MLRGLRESDVEVIECHTTVWTGGVDKSQIRGLGRRLYFLLRWLFSYPKLIIRYLGLPPHDAVMIGYLGQIDVLVLWPFARARGVAIVWDAYISLYDTVVADRNIVGPKHPGAMLLFALEWLSCRAADQVILDTRAHAEYFEKAFRLEPGRTVVVYVGVEPEHFPSRPRSAMPEQANAPVRVLFYGSFIPLHGIETIVRAAEMAKDGAIDWLLIGGGQEESRIRQMLAKLGLTRLTWIPRVKYGELKDWIHRADICLGIFGASEKAARVIPNKVFQVLATGTPIITRDSPAIRELLAPDMPGVWLVPAADPDALLMAVRKFAKQRAALTQRRLHGNIARKITPKNIGHHTVKIIDRARWRDEPFGKWN